MMNKGPGTSGKKVVIGVVIFLASVGSSIGYCLWCYTKVEETRRDSAEAWRSVAVELEQRYRSIEKEVAQSIDDQTLPMAWGEKFRLAVDRFRTSASPVIQRTAAQAVESELESSSLTRDILIPSAILEERIGAYNETSESELAAQRAPGAQVLATVLQYPEAAGFELSKIKLQTGSK